MSLADALILGVSVAAAGGAALLANALASALQERYRFLQFLGPRAMVIGVAGLAVLLLLVTTLDPDRDGPTDKPGPVSVMRRPDDTVWAFWAAAQSLNCEEATNLISDAMFTGHDATREQAIAECNADTSSETWEPRAKLLDVILVSENGDASVVVAHGAGWVQEITLVREDGKWRISEFAELVRT